MRLPPYGNQLSPSHSIIYIFIGNKAWESAKKKSINEPDSFLVLPSDNTASSFIWPVKDKIVLIIETSLCQTNYILSFVKCLFACGAQDVLLYSISKKTTHFEKDF